MNLEKMNVFSETMESFKKVEGFIGLDDRQGFFFTPEKLVEIIEENGLNYLDSKLEVRGSEYRYQFTVYYKSTKFFCIFNKCKLTGSKFYRLRSLIEEFEESKIEYEEV